MEEDEEEEEGGEVELRTPGPFDFGDHSGAADDTPGVDTVEPFDAVGMLENLWREMQLK